MTTTNESLNTLTAAKNNIEKSINLINARKSQMESSLQVVAPSSEIDTKISELELQKQVVVLKGQQNEIETKYQFILQNITEEELNTQNQLNTESTNAELKLIDDQISILKEQKNAKNPYASLVTKKEKNKKNRDSIKSEIRKKRTQAASNLLKILIKTQAEIAIAGALSKILHNQFSTSITQTGKLETVVDNVNTQIDAIKIRADIEKAKKSRNDALLLLNTVESKLISLNKILQTIEKITTVLLLVVKALKILSNVIILPGPKAILENKLDKVERILTAILVILKTASNVLTSIINVIEDLKAKLKQIGDLLDALSTNENVLSSDDISKLIGNNYGKLGMLDITYKGFRFVIKEEFNKQFVVQSHKRRYAIAINRDGTEVIKSEYSFTLDPDVLVEQLKIVIDEQNLKS